MPGNWVGIIIGAFVMLVGLVQASRPSEAAHFSVKTTPKVLRMFQPDWSDDLWLPRLVGIIIALAGLGTLVFHLLLP